MCRYLTSQKSRISERIKGSVTSGILHEHEDLTDAPRFLLTDAVHWESGRVIQTWSYALASEVFPEKGQAGMGLGVIRRKAV
jgi:hypothetical protein